MKLLRYETLPKGHDYYESEAFSEWYVERLESSGADLVAYWYGAGSYEGTGHILARKNGQWYHHNCGHCSCYGPVEDGIFNGDGDASLEALLARCSEELRGYLEPLATLISTNGRADVPEGDR
ncbi:MAG: hypothetical protein IAE97_06335 [Chthoniobacterales bacterium]|nr:hypothetical protein [Chthoniobacterales bacterium]